MIKIAICDDNNNICSQIESLLLQYAKRQHLQLTVDIFYSGENLIQALEQGADFDLIYLDIELGAMNGVAVGQTIRKVMKNLTTEIVYISGNDGYDRQLFEVQPLHFIPKPLNANIIIEDLNLALERLQKNSGFFKFQKSGESYKIPFKDILYFESLNREMKVVFTDGVELFYGTMDEVAAQLTNVYFIQIHRSYWINHDYATTFKYYEVVMANGDVLPISRSKRQEIRALQIEQES